MDRLGQQIVPSWLGLLCLLSISCSDPHAGHDHDDQLHPGEEAVREKQGLADNDKHDEVSLGTADIDGLPIELAQGHGLITAGQDAELVVKLPYSDKGATTIRAWIGTEDRTLSYVGRGEYESSHDDYAIHATAPDPLPDNPLWWIEIEKPDGTRLLGSAKPLQEEN